MDVNLWREINDGFCHNCVSYFWKASLQPWGVSGCGRSWTPRAECEARAWTEEKAELTILASSSGESESDTRGPLSRPAIWTESPRENWTDYNLRI